MGSSADGDHPDRVATGETTAGGYSGRVCVAGRPAKKWSWKDGEKVEKWSVMAGSRSLHVHY